MGLADTGYNKGIKSKKEEKKHIHSHNSTPSAFLPPHTYILNSAWQTPGRDLAQWLHNSSVMYSFSASSAPQPTLTSFL